ncbi:J domain-containing protein [Helicobacter sp. T3_23-1056]
MQSIAHLENAQKSTTTNSTNQRTPFNDFAQSNDFTKSSDLTKSSPKKPAKQKRKSKHPTAKTQNLAKPDFDKQDSSDRDFAKYNDELANILSYSHLPIRIKITNPNTLLKRIKVQIHLSNLGQILVRLPENNRVARRYIRAIFGSNILYEVDNEFCISAVGYTQSMWEGVMGLISSRIIHNIALDFEFNSNKDEDFGGEMSGFGGEGFDSFLTREEYLLRKCYSELNVDFRDSFAEVKKQYLKLAKKFHPDNALGKDSAEAKIFEERFKKISQAYNTIKASTTSLADKTTA